MRYKTDKGAVQSTARRGIIIQARMSSKRFPGKMLARVAGVPLIEYLYKRCVRSTADSVLVATSIESSDDALYAYCAERKIPAARGDLTNVVKRFVTAAEAAGIGYICRVCGDTPLVDVALIDSLFDRLVSRSIDYVAPDRRTCASGFFSETCTLAALKKVLAMARSSDDLEHVTKYILDNRDIFSVELVDAGLNPEFARETRFTVDFPEDIETVKTIVGRLPDGAYSSRDVLAVVRSMR